MEGFTQKAYLINSSQPSSRVDSAAVRHSQHVEKTVWIENMLTGLFHLTVLLSMVAFIIAIYFSFSVMLMFVAGLTTLTSLCIVLGQQHLRNASTWMESCIAVLWCLFVPFMMILLSFSSLLSFLATHA